MKNSDIQWNFDSELGDFLSRKGIEENFISKKELQKFLKGIKCNEYAVRVFGVSQKIEARTYDEKTLANAVIEDIEQLLCN